MKTNLSPEAQEIMLQARKSSICMDSPAINEELTIPTFIKLQHPLWLIVKNKFGLDQNWLFNSVSDYPMRSDSDNLQDPKN